MKTEVIHPRDIIPWEHEDHAARYVRKMKKGNWDNYPAIPVFHAPQDLQHLGRYVQFNGHRRRASAIRAGLQEITVHVIENDHDLSSVQENGENMHRHWKNTFEAQYFVEGRARRFNGV